MIKSSSIVSALLLFVSSIQAAVLTPGGGAGTGGSGGSNFVTYSGVPNVTNLQAGSTLTAALAALANNSTIQLGDGLYTVTPSILNSNLTAGNAFSGAQLLNKTNITILGVPGRSIIDGSSGLGECLWVSNCSNIKIIGVTIRGMTNHNFMALPRYGNSSPPDYLWAGVNVFKCENVLFENCTIERHTDHGIQDKGSESIAASSSANSPGSTNQMVIRNCYFEDIGGWRTNSTAGGSIATDGTAVVCTGWTIENCKFRNCLRGIEPYDEADANGQVFYNFKAVNNEFYNMIDFAVGMAGSTNAHNGIISGNRLVNRYPQSYHGTNFGAVLVSVCTGYNINGGRGWKVTDNTAEGSMYAGFSFQNSVSFLDDCLVSRNAVTDINRGDGISYGFIVGDSANSANAASSVRRMKFTDNDAYNTPYSGFLIVAARDSIFTGNIGIKANLYSAVNIFDTAMKIGIAGNSSAFITNIVVNNNTMIDAGAGAPFGYVVEDNVRSITFNDNTATGFAIGDGLTNRSAVIISMIRISSNFVTSAHGSITVTNTLTMGGGSGAAFINLPNYTGSSFSISRATNAPNDTGGTNDFQIAQSAKAGDGLKIFSSSAGYTITTNSPITLEVTDTNQASVNIDCSLPIDQYLIRTSRTNFVISVTNQYNVRLGRQISIEFPTNSANVSLQFSNVAIDRLVWSPSFTTNGLPTLTKTNTTHFSAVFTFPVTNYGVVDASWYR